MSRFDLNLGHFPCCYAPTTSYAGASARHLLRLQFGRGHGAFLAEDVADAWSHEWQIPSRDGGLGASGQEIPFGVGVQVWRQQSLQSHVVTVGFEVGADVRPCFLVFCRCQSHCGRGNWWRWCRVERRGHSAQTVLQIPVQNSLIPTRVHLTPSERPLGDFPTRPEIRSHGRETSGVWTWRRLALYQRLDQDKGGEQTGMNERQVDQFTRASTVAYADDRTRHFSAKMINHV